MTGESRLERRRQVLADRCVRGRHARDLEQHLDPSVAIGVGMEVRQQPQPREGLRAGAFFLDRSGDPEIERQLFGSFLDFPGPEGLERVEFLPIVGSEIAGGEHAGEEDGRVDGGELAVTGAHRSPALPDVPTLAEAGAPDQESEIILAVLVPGGTPQEVIERLYREIVRIVALPDVRDRLSALGFEPIASTPKQLADRIKWEIEKWAKVIRTANIKAQ